MIDCPPAPAQTAARPRADGPLQPVRATSRWTAALRIAGLECLSLRPGALSLLVPTDAAFEALLQELGLSWQALCSDTLRLRRLLLAHVLPQALDGRALRQPGLLLSSLGGSVLRVEPDQRLSDGQGRCATVLHSAPQPQRQRAGLALVHQIDRVLPPPRLSLLEQLACQPDLSEFLAALRHCGLDSLLQGEGPMTVFAPRNSGFAHLAARLGLRQRELTVDPELIAGLLRHHLVAGRWLSQELPWGNALNTAQGRPLHIGALGLIGNGEAAQSLLAGSDLAAHNGVIHRIGQALLPGF